MTDARLGRRLGDFRIDELLHRGPRASIYRGTQLRLNREVAVKIFEGGSVDPAAFLALVGKTAALEHPNLLPIYGAGQDDDGCCYLVMRRVDGSLQGNLSWKEGVRLLEGVCRGLTCAHDQGFVHGDIKPSNILISDDTAVLADIGQAGLRGATSDDLEALTRVLEKFTDGPAELTEVIKRARHKYYATAEELRADLLSLMNLPDSHATRRPETVKPMAMPRATASTPAPAQPRKFGAYILHERLGHGGMGIVYRAEQTGLGRMVALKVLQGGEDFDEALVKRFEREARAVASLRHPNIVPIHEFGVADGKHFFTMDLIEGGDLDNRTLPPKRTAEVIRDAARGVQYAHDRGIVHRDIKPSNLMVDASGRVVVMDFGLAKTTKVDGSLSQSGMIVGTPAFMPPEQAQGLRVADGRVDIYSLGATAYALLTGKNPFTGENTPHILIQVVNDEPPRPRTLRPDLPADLETIVLKAMEKDPNRRYPTADALADDLDRFLEGEPIQARPPSLAYRLQKLVTKRKGIVAALAAGILGIGIVLAILLPKWRAEAEGRRKSDAALHDRQEREDKARPFLESGRRMTEEMRILRRQPEHSVDKLWTLVGAAEAEFRKALDVYPDHPDAWLAIGRLKVLIRVEKEALEALAHAIAAAPKSAAAYVERAKFRMDLYGIDASSREGSGSFAAANTKELAEIRSDLANADRYSTDRTERLYIEALEAMLAGKKTEAVERFGEYLKVAPGDPIAYMWQAMMVGQQGNLPDAERLMSESIACDTRLPVAYEGRGKVRHDLGRFKEAIEDYTKAIEYTKIYPSALDRRGESKLELGDLEGAMADYNLSIEQRPNVMAYLHRSHLRAQMRDPQGAIDDNEKAIQLDPMHADAYAMRATLQSNVKRDYAAAIADCDKALSINPKCSLAILHRAIARRMAKDLDGSIADFEKLIELKEQVELAYANRGNIYVEKGMLKEALADFDQAIQLKPRPESYFNRGIARMKSGDNDGALEDFSTALRLNPLMQDVLANRGALYFKMGKIAEAVADAKEALRVAPPGWPYRQGIEDFLKNHEKP